MITLVHVEVSVYESIVLLRLGEIACSGFQNFFMPPHLWTGFGGKVIREGASGRFKESHCGLFCFSYRIFHLLTSFRTKPTGKILDLIAHVLVPPLCSLLCITFIYIVTHGI